MRREITNDRGNAEQAGLLEEPAQIVTGKLPGLTARVRQLSGKWAEQTLGEVERELEYIEPEVQSLLSRQREIAARLRSMLES